MPYVILRRLGLAVPTLVGVTLALFFTLRMLPGDPVDVLLGSAPSGPDVAENLRAQFGLDESLPEQYWGFVSGAAQGDLGTSFTTRQPVSDMIGQQLWPTVQLTVAAAAVSAGVGIALGAIAAMFRGRWIDALIRVLSLVNTAMPSFWLGLLLILTFSFRFTVFPATGSDSWQALVLPAVTLGLSAAGTVTRLVRNSVLEVLGESFVTALHAKGLTTRTIIGKHVLRNAVIPTITIVGFQLGALLAGAVIVETVFARQGIGQMLVQAVANKDYPVVQGVVLVVAAAYVLINIVVDVSYTVVDPRLRAVGATSR